MTRAKNFAEVATYIEVRYDFQHTSMSGHGHNNRLAPELVEVGALPDEWKVRLRAALSDLSGMSRGARVYVVRSYQTPIGWVTSDNDLVIPDVTYSATTTRHQALVREHLIRRER